MKHTSSRTSTVQATQEEKEASEEPQFLPISGSNYGERLAFVSTAIHDQSKTKMTATSHINHSRQRHHQQQHHSISYGSNNNENSNATCSNIGGVIFCNGFRSSMAGNKALALETWCRFRSVPFTRFDYRGHGRGTYDEAYSGGVTPENYFESMGMNEWIADANLILQTCIGHDQPHQRPQVLVGSSMGCWIAFHLARMNPNQVAGILGIAAAPDFTQDLQNQLDPEQKEDLVKFQRVLIPSEYSDEPYPISQYLLDDGNNWLLLQDGKECSINVTCPVRLIHGQRDLDIPWQNSMQLAEAVATDNVIVTLIKSGDHRLSRRSDLDVILGTLKELIECADQHLV